MKGVTHSYSVNQRTVIVISAALWCFLASLGSLFWLRKLCSPSRFQDQQAAVSGKQALINPQHAPHPAPSRTLTKLLIIIMLTVAFHTFNLVIQCTVMCTFEVLESAKQLIDYESSSWCERPVMLLMLFRLLNSIQLTAAAVTAQFKWSLMSVKVDFNTASLAVITYCKFMRCSINTQTHLRPLTNALLWSPYWLFDVWWSC